MSFFFLITDDAKPQSRGRHTSVMLGSLLDDHLWHSVLIERFNKQVNFTVDKDTQHFRTQGQEDSLEVDYEVRVKFLAISAEVVQKLNNW